MLHSPPMCQRQTCVPIGNVSVWKEHHTDRAIATLYDLICLRRLDELTKIVSFPITLLIHSIFTHCWISATSLTEETGPFGMMSYVNFINFDTIYK